MFLPRVYLGISCNLYYSITEHQNWFGMDENLGPVAVSIRRERIERQNDPNSASALSTQPSHTYHYRLLIRTSEVSCYFVVVDNGCGKLSGITVYIFSLSDNAIC
jgi:hypothetical protein